MKVDASGYFYIVGYGLTTKGAAPLNKDIWLYALDKNGQPIWDQQGTSVLSHMMTWAMICSCSPMDG